MSSACVMGHKTWLTLKRPLPNRLNIVLTRKAEIEPHDSVVVAHDIESVLAMEKDLIRDIYVIGGGQVYTSFLPYIDKWIVTEVPLSVEGADAFVPENYLDGFDLVESKQLDDELIVSVYERTKAA